jgi:hypothetical protein
MKPRMIPVCSPWENPHQPMIWTTHLVEFAMVGVALKVMFMVISPYRGFIGSIFHKK